MTTETKTPRTKRAVRTIRTAAGVGGVPGRRTHGLLVSPKRRRTILVEKLPEVAIESVRGRVPIGMRHEHYQHLRPPVLRTVTTIYGRPVEPLALETFTNAQDEELWDDFATLARQDGVLFVYYDEGLRHRQTKQVENTSGEQMNGLLNWAGRIARAIPPCDYEFDAAEAAVLRTTTMHAPRRRPAPSRLSAVQEGCPSRDRSPAPTRCYR